MKRILAALGVTSLAILGASATAIASPTESPGGGDMITICHATGSSTNPYVQITMNLNGLNGHANSNHQLEEDIIPANNGDVMPQGSNLDKVDIWNAGCVAPGGEPNGNGGHKITICHATGSATNPFVVITIDLNGLNGHANANHQLSEDIIPPNDGTIVPEGQNWTAEGQATFNNGCVPTTVPPTVPPTMPPSGAVVPTPSGAAAGGGAGAVVATNPGFNVQTAVSDSTGVALAPWAGGLALMLLAAAGVAVRKTLPASGLASRRRQD